MFYFSIKLLALKKILYFILINFLALSCSQDNKTGSIRSEKKSNDLIKETSPYLLQHAYNPVDWKAWNDESLKIAKEQNKLIIISVGYSACHWCHVIIVIVICIIIYLLHEFNF